MNGILPKDLMEDTYPDPVPSHPDDLAPTQEPPLAPPGVPSESKAPTPEEE